MNAPESLSQEDGEKPAGLFDKSVCKFIYNHSFVFCFCPRLYGGNLTGPICVILANAFPQAL